MKIVLFVEEKEFLLVNFLTNSIIVKREKAGNIINIAHLNLYISHEKISKFRILNLIEESYSKGLPAKEASMSSFNELDLNLNLFTFQL